MLSLHSIALVLFLSVAPLFAAADFHVHQQKVEAPETGQFVVCQIFVGKESYSFVPPRNWYVREESDQKRIVLRCLDTTASMTITFSEGAALDLTEANREALRETVLKRFSRAQILEEFPCYTSTHQGRGFQVAWKTGEVEMISRVATFLTKSGNIDFVLTTTPARIRTVQAAFGAVLTSFQLLTPPANAQFRLRSSAATN